MSAPRPSWFSPLWLGRTTPGAYLATGTLLAIGLMLVESVVARSGFGRRSPIASYVVTGDPLGLLALGRDDRDFLVAMLLISAPFLAAGLLLTLRRLRDARWPLGLSAFILAPTPIESRPPPMREWSPLFEAHPPHLDGFLVSERGQFELIPRPGGGTLLRGSTLYRHGLWPAAYWRLWSDPIIHRIHDRVLRHIKRLAESGPRRSPAAPAPGASPP